MKGFSSYEMMANTFWHWLEDESSKNEGLMQIKAFADKTEDASIAAP